MGVLFRSAVPAEETACAGKCLIRVTAGSAGPFHPDELRILSQEQRASGIRMSCRVHPEQCTDLRVELVHSESEGQVAVSYRAAPKTFNKPVSDAEEYGIAVDIGTTTVVVFLVRLSTQEIISHTSGMNSQRAYGGDVISRIQWSNEHNDGLKDLQSRIVKQLDTMIQKLLAGAGIRKISVSRMVAVGNPTMIHLLVGADPEGIANAPFTPAFTEPVTTTSGDLGFSFSENTEVILPGCVSAYIGSDITAGVYSSSVMQTGKKILYIDIGTNGEIVLWDGSHLYSCSSAAGPAFEGASIHQGMAAFPGAVDHLWMSDSQTIEHSTIAGEEAKGICGSGIIDITAVLLELDLIEDTGAMNTDHPHFDRYTVETERGPGVPHQ